MKKYLNVVILTLFSFCVISAQTESKEARSYDERGLIFLRQLELDKAILNFSKAIELDPNFSEAYLSRGYVYEMKGRDQYETRGRGYKDKGFFDKAIEDYSKTLELDPNLPDALLYLGLCYIEKSDLKRASEMLEKTRKINSKNNFIYNNQGLLYAGLGDYENALKSYDVAIQLNESRKSIIPIPMFRNRAIAFAAIGKYEQAIADYTKELEIRSDAYTHSLRAWAMYLKGDYENALKDINSAVKLYPKSAYPLVTRGTIYLNKEKYDLALADYHKAIELKPINADYYRARASVYRKKKEVDLAEADEKKASELEEPDDKSATIN